MLNDNIFSLKFGVQLQKIENRIEQKFVLTDEEYKTIISEHLDKIKILRGALRYCGFTYHYTKPNSLLYFYLKEKEYTYIEDMLNEKGKDLKKRYFDENNYDSDDSDGNEYNYAYNESQMISNGEISKTNIEENASLYDNHSLLNLKNDAMNNINEILAQKSNEIILLNKNIEEIKQEKITIEKKLSEIAHNYEKEINELKYKMKKDDLEIIASNEFVFTLQNDVIISQTKIEKKSNKISLLKEKIKDLSEKNNDFFIENEKLTSQNQKQQRQIFSLVNDYDKNKLELENLKLDKLNSNTIIENLKNAEELNKEKIKDLIDEKKEFNAKIKELKNAKKIYEENLTSSLNIENSNNKSEFICKFCDNKQIIDISQFTCNFFI